MKTLLIGCGFLALLGVDNIALATDSEPNCCSKLIASTPAATTAQKNDAADPVAGDTTTPPAEGDASAEPSTNDASGDEGATDEAAADDSSAAETD